MLISTASASLPKSPSASEPALANESRSQESGSQENRAARIPHAQLSAIAQGAQANALLKNLRINGERIADTAELVLKEGDALTLSFDSSESTTVDESLGTLTFNLKKLNNGAD